LVRLPFKSNAFEGDANYAFFNPFRDRSPERAAAAYLDAMRLGNCSEASKVAAIPPMPDVKTCERVQQENRRYGSLFVQPLRDRKDLHGDVSLYYSQTGYEGNWVHVQKVAGEWKVVMFAKIW
jgi:hypothetical protein